MTNWTMKDDTPIPNRMVDTDSSLNDSAMPIVPFAMTTEWLESTGRRGVLNLITVSGNPPRVTFEYPVKSYVNWLIGQSVIIEQEWTREKDPKIREYANDLEMGLKTMFLLIKEYFQDEFDEPLGDCFATWFARLRSEFARTFVASFPTV